MGILFLRLGAGILVIHLGIDSLSKASLGDPVTVARDAVAAVAGILLLAGLWTPIAGVVMALDELWIAFAQPVDVSTHILLAAMGAGLALLGPGAWSVDSRLFGRKLFGVAERRRGRPLPP